MISLLASTGALAAAPSGRADYGVPRFRHTESLGKPPSFDHNRKIVLLADDDFAPFSYADADGQLRGLAVDTARAACTRMTLQCEFKAVPWAMMQDAIKSGTADAAISGLRVGAPLLATLEPTRPIYRALGRIAVRKESPVKRPDTASLAGKRIAVVAGSAHEVWLKNNLPDAEPVFFGDLSLAESALQTSHVDALFGDALQLVYWTEGSSGSCCRLADGAFVDEATFSRAFSFFVKKGDNELRDTLDYALDQMQDSGEFAKIFRVYVPASPW
ncbi:ABC transporter substrate-binding protein [soil metagenome]